MAARPGLLGRAFDRLHARLRERLAAMADDPDDEARQQFNAWIAGFPSACRPRRSCASAGRASSASCWPSAGSATGTSLLWKNAKETLRVQAPTRTPRLRRRLAGALAAGGRRLGSDPALQESLERVLESGARRLADQFHDELAGL